MTILTVSELEQMELPVDLSGYTPDQLSSLLNQAVTWVNGEARHTRGFEMSRVVDRVYGTGTNRLKTTYFPVLALNSINLIFPPNLSNNVNLPGPNQVPIDPGRVVVDYEAGLVFNWSPFVFQTIGYMTVFPEHVPINIDYLQGYVLTTLTSNAVAGQNMVPVTSASGFHWSQGVRTYEPVNYEWVLVQGATQVGNQQYLVTQDPLTYTHITGSTIGDMPEEVRKATAFIVCDLAIRSLNPEDLQVLKLDKLEKHYQVKTRPIATATGANDFIYEQERELIKEARRLLARFHADQGIN